MGRLIPFGFCRIVAGRRADRRARAHRERAVLIAEILKEKGEAVFSISPEAPLRAACEELESRRVGALVVCESDQVVGVFSERDVVRAVANGGAAALDQPVSRYMTREVIFAFPTETVAMLMTRMTENRVRHLPVLREHSLVGVISIGDVVKRQIAQAQGEAEQLRSYIAGG